MEAEKPRRAAGASLSSASDKAKRAALPPPARSTQPVRMPTVRDFLRIFSYAEPLDWPMIVAGSAASVGSGITMPLMNVVFSKLVGNFSLFGGASDAAAFQHALNRQSLYIFVLFLARFALNYVKMLAFRMISIRLSAALRLHYLRCLFAQTVHVLDSMPSGLAANTLTTTANTLQVGISENLGTGLEFTASLVASLVVAFFYSWRLALVVLSDLAFVVLVAGLAMPFVSRAEARLARAENVANAVAAESFANIRMLVACGAESRMARTYNAWVHEARRHGRSMAPFLGALFGAVFFSLYAGFSLAFWYGLKLLRDGRIDGVGTAVVVVLSVTSMVMAVERVVTPLVAASKAMVAAADFFAVIDVPPPGPGHRTAPDVSAGEDLVFAGVDFAYPGRPHVKVLDGLTLRLAAGKVNALVGPSGSGKSTIVGLIERWYSLQNEQPVVGTATQEGGDVAGPPRPRIELKGSITIGGRRLDEVNVRWWRAQIGLVQQEPFLFNDTIFNNVAFGLVGSAYETAPDHERRRLVEAACEEACAVEFIRRLPDGYQTRVGESGAKLSGGQRQRIAIARSIVKQPQILILDEATSAIDVRSERIVQAALDRVSRNRTTVTVAHRLSTIKAADTIFVLDQGRCAEEGTHEALLAREHGIYRRLVDAQQLSLGDGGAASDETGVDGVAADGSKRTSSAGDASSDNHGDDMPSAPVGTAAAAAAAANTPPWKSRGFVRSFGRLLYEQRSGFPYYAIILVLAVGASSSTPLYSFLFAKLVVVFGQLALATAGAVAAGAAQAAHDGNFYALMFFVMALGVGLSYCGVVLVAGLVEHNVCAAYREEYFVSVVRQRIAFFDDEAHATGTLTSNVGGDPKVLRELLGIHMTMAATSVLTVIGTPIVAFVFGWKLALLSFAVTVPLVVIAGFYRNRYEMEFASMNSAVFAESSKWAAESIGAFRTVASLTLEDVICQRYQELLAAHVRRALTKARLTIVLFALSNSISLGCQALIFWYGGRLVARGEYSVASFFVCYMAAIQGAEWAGQGFSFLPNAAQVTAASNRILAIRETRATDRVPLTEQIPDTDAAADTRLGNRGARIELRDVHFRYPTRDVAVFRGLSLTIERGKFTAIVGASGSGKTSIIALLERFYAADQGTILCNGRNIAEVNVQTYRRLLSLVSQEPALFQGTIRENLMLGVGEDSDVSEADLVQACRDASIHDFIASLPDGYNTDLGSRAVSLSGGQKQRVAIARALLRNPRVLLLDEATSSLDSDTEKTIQATFERVTQGRTTVAVAHRLSTIQKADVIYVLGDGRVLEKGSHSELLRLRGVYWSMCQSQALGA